MIDNVYKKLLKKEVGSDYYIYNTMITEAGEEVEPYIFEHMYEKLEKAELKDVKKKKQTLSDTFLTAFYINRKYKFFIIFSLLAILFLLARGIAEDVFLASFTLIMIFIIYKSYEYFCHKFSYEDLQVIIIYKMVLEKVFLEKKKQDELLE